MWRCTRLARLPPRNMTLRDPACAAALQRCTSMVYSSLPNGVRVATEYIAGCPFATVGVWIDAGSRFETPANSGVAHFLEHMNFKGTARFARRELEALFEHHGAHFNAYTSRDRTAYYVKALCPHIPHMIDVVADLLQHGRYRASDLEAERHTILAEMREVESLVDEVIMDHVHQAAYDVTTSGLPLTILGPEDNIARVIDVPMIEAFVRTHYTGPRMCLVSSGGVTPEQAHALAERYLGALPSLSHRPQLHGEYVGGTTVMCNEAMATANTAVAFPLCGATHPDSYALQLIHNVLGQVRDGALHQFGHQRRNVHLPLEQLPNLLHLRPFYTPYEETALLGYQVVTERLAWPDRTDGNTSSSCYDPAQTILLDYVLSSLYDLCHTRVDDDLLEQAKSEFKASVMMMRDSTTNSAEDIGRQMIHHGRRVPLAEVFAHVDAVTPSALRDAAARHIGAVTPVVSCIGGLAALPRCAPSRHVALKRRPRLHRDDFVHYGSCSNNSSSSSSNSSAATAAASAQQPSVEQVAEVVTSASR